MRIDPKNWAPCAHCGDYVEPDDVFRLFDGDDIVHESCVDEYRNARLDVDPKMGLVSECGKAVE